MNDESAPSGDDSAGDDSAGGGALAVSAGVGAAVAACAGLAVAAFLDWGESPEAEWVSRGVWPALFCIGLAVAAVAARDRAPGTRRLGVVGLTVIAVLLLVGCGWVLVSDNAPVVAGLGWPLIGLSAIAAVVAAALWCFGGWRTRPSARPVALWLSAAAVLAMVVGLAFPLRQAINVESVTTAAALSPPARDEVRWVARSHGYQREVAVSSSGVFIAEGDGAEPGKVATAASLLALDPVTGGRRWSYTDTAHPPQDPLADVTGDAVLARSGADLLVFDAVTGHVRDRIEDFTARPAAANDEIVVAESTVGRGDQSHDYGQAAPDGLAGFDYTGAEVWDVPLPPRCVLLSAVSGNVRPVDEVTVSDGRVFALALCGTTPAVISVRADDGGGLRQQSVPVPDSFRDPECGRLRASGGALAVMTCAEQPAEASSQLTALATDDLTVRWQASVVAASIFGPPLTVDDNAVYTTGDRRCSIAVLDPDGGQQGPPVPYSMSDRPEPACDEARDLYAARGALVLSDRSTVSGISRSPRD